MDPPPLLKAAGWCEPVEAGRQITFIPETAMVCATNWDTRIFSAGECTKITSREH